VDGISIFFFKKKKKTRVEGIKNVLKSFQSSQVVHVKRDANSAAHQLAKEAVFMS
jgi:hypothetical protein